MCQCSSKIRSCFIYEIRKKSEIDEDGNGGGDGGGRAERKEGGGLWSKKGPYSDNRWHVLYYYPAHLPLEGVRWEKAQKCNQE